MAALDKTYITASEYPAYRQWWIDNYTEMIIAVGEAIWLYPFVMFEDDNEFRQVNPDLLEVDKRDFDYFEDDGEYPIWNTTTQQDIWLLKHCKIQSYQDRMREVYNEEFINENTI